MFNNFKIKTLTFIFSAVLWLNTDAQQIPVACANIPKDYTFINENIIEGIDLQNCSINANKELRLKSSLSKPISNANIYFDFLESKSIEELVGGKSISENIAVSYTLKKGENWMLITGLQEGKKVVVCQKYEYLPVRKPLIESNLCSSNPVELKINGVFPGQILKVDWGDGNLEKVKVDNSNATLQHVPTGDWQAISVQSFYELDDKEVCNSESAKLERDIPEPIFLTSLEGLADSSEIKIRYKGNRTPIFPIEAMNPDAESVQWTEVSMGEAGEGTIIGIDPQQKYCFRLVSKNECGEKFYSMNTLCNIVVEREVVSASEMKVLWNIPKYPESQPNSLKINKGDSSNTLEEFSNTETTSYLDKNLKCGIKYLYQIETKYPAEIFNGQQETVFIKTSFISKEISDTHLDEKPAYIGLAGYSPLHENTLEFKVHFDREELSQIKEITYFKNESGEDKLLQKGLKNELNVNLTKDSRERQCFRYQITDVCGISTSLSDSYCTIRLDYNAEELLSWTPLNLPEGYSPKYEIEYKMPEEVAYKSLSTINDGSSYNLTDFLKTWDNPEIQFRIAASVDGVDNSPFYSNSVQYKFLPMVFVPSAFSPNGEGPNTTEYFSPLTKFAKEGSFTIIDRLGNVLYKSNSLTDRWDGTDHRKGQSVPIGTYYYKITAVGFDGKSSVFVGALTLLR